MLMEAFSILIKRVINNLNSRREFSEIVEAIEAISLEQNLSILEEARLFEDVVRELARMEK